MASVFKRGGRRSKGNWYASWFDHTGKRQTKSTRTTDKATAERIARKHEADAALRRDGVIDPTLDATSRESQRAIEDHLADYEGKLRAAGRTEKHIRCTTRFIGWIADFAGFAKPADISAEGVNRYAGKLLDEGRANRTVQAHISAIKAFTRWLSDQHKLPRDPLSSVKKPNPKADRRLERRVLLPEEWQRLEKAAEAGPVRYGMTGAERALLYSTAIQTGLRASELRSLTRGRLYLDFEPPYVTCGSGSTKNRKDARQYIQPELAESLEDHVGTKAPRAPLFTMPHESNLARMLRDDLAEARAGWLREAATEPLEHARRDQSDFLAATSHEGETFDFHSLRHTCGAWLAMTGAHVKVVQTVMRHQSVTLTMDTYGHLFPGQEADAVAKLRTMLTNEGNRLADQTLQATGTDGLPLGAQDQAQRMAQQSQRGVRQVDAGQCESPIAADPLSTTPKPLQFPDLGVGVREFASCDASSGGGTRTPDTRIMIPLL